MKNVEQERKKAVKIILSGDTVRVLTYFTGPAEGGLPE